jgi:hypothetical protein
MNSKWEVASIVAATGHVTSLLAENLKPHVAKKAAKMIQRVCLQKDILLKEESDGKMTVLWRDRKIHAAG